MYFDETELNDHVLDALYDMRFDRCTPIQEKCIPPILEGRDLLGVAQTGTGKTAAYLLPILSKLDDGGYPHDAINCVIMSPTRELAQQIDQAMQGFGYYLNGVSSVAVYGGNDGNRYDQELKSFQMGADVVIATPGRLISHISLGSADLSRVSFFVLDEADRMLDMGFSEDIKMIASKLPDTCQTIMFSATMPQKIEELAKTLLKNPMEVKIAVSKPAEKIKQSAYVCYETQKIGIIKELFRKGDLNRVIIFSGKKQKVKAINRTLQQMKINSGEMHSDLEQAERDDILYKFKTGQIDVLVATDIVARGIDIDDIAMVINFDVPHDPEDYVHRIGRTARAQRDGVAITFVCEDEISSFKQIEKFLGKVVDKNALPEGLGEGPDYNAPRSRGKGGKGRDGKRPQKKQRRGGDRTTQKQPAAEGEKSVAQNEKPVAEGENTVAEGEKPVTEGEATERKKRNRKPRNRKPRPENTADGTQQNGSEAKAEQNGGPGNQNNENAGNAPTGENAERKPRRNRKPRRKPQDGEQPNTAGNQTQKRDNRRGNNGERGERANGEGKQKHRERKGNPNRQQREKPNSRKIFEASVSLNVPTIPAEAQSGLKNILKKPINWLKSLGKKKDK